MTPFWLFIDGSVRWKVHIFNVKCLNLALSLNKQAICNSQDCACTAPHSTTQFLPLRVRREGLEDPNDKTKTNILNNNTATVITSTFLLTIQRIVIHLRGESPTCYSKLIYTNTLTCRDWFPCLNQSRASQDWPTTRKNNTFSFLSCDLLFKLFRKVVGLYV